MTDWWRDREAINRLRFELAIAAPERSGQIAPLVVDGRIGLVTDKLVRLTDLDVGEARLLAMRLLRACLDAEAV